MRTESEFKVGNIHLIEVLSWRIYGAPLRRFDRPLVMEMIEFVAKIKTIKISALLVSHYMIGFDRNHTHLFNIEVKSVE